MRRRTRTTEEMYDDLVDHIQEVFEQIAWDGYKEKSNLLSPDFMLDHILDESLRWKEHYEKQIQEAQNSLKYNFGAVRALFGLTDDEK